MADNSKPKLTVFYCNNAFPDGFPVQGGEEELKIVPLACSSMVKDVFLLRAFEAGADAVIVIVCPEGACRFIEGNLRAKKRVAWTKNILDEIGLDGKRLSLHNIAPGDQAAAEAIIRKAADDAAGLGPNPAVRQTAAE